MSLPDEAAAPPHGAGRRRAMLRRLMDGAGILPLLMAVLLILFSVGSPHFLTWNNIYTILTQSVYLIIITIAQAVVLVTGGFDLSIGSALALISIVTSTIILAHAQSSAAGIALGFLGGVGTGTLVGAVNGLVVALFGVSPFIVTLAMMSIVYGLALIITGGIPVFGLPGFFGDTLHTGRLLGIPTPWLFTGAVLVLAYLVLNWTRLGRYWYAIGGNAEAARLSGVPVRAYLFLAYTAAGLLVGIGGVLLTARVGSGEPNLGSTAALESIAAAVLGGVSLRGGEGRLLGVVLGAIFLVLLRNGLHLIGMGTYAEMVVTGALLIFAIIIDRYIHAR